VKLRLPHATLREAPLVFLISWVAVMGVAALEVQVAATAAVAGAAAAVVAAVAAVAGCLEP
jgi:hypothetical protein